MSSPLLLSSSSTPPPLPMLVPSTTVYQIRIEACFAIAFCSLLMYYWTLRMDREAKYFWPGPITTVTCIFYANRCFGLLGGISRVVYNGFRTQTTSLCRVTFWTGTISNWSIITLLDYILILRVAALYGQNKILDVCLKLLLVAQSAGSLGVLIYFTFVENPYALNLTTGITVCTLTVEPPRELAIAWALPTAYGFLLLCLTLYKAAEFSRRSAGFKGFQLVRIIVQDQTTYYCFLIAIAALRIATVFVRDIGIALVLIAAASPVLLSILGDQLLINLKEAGARCLDDEASYWVDNLDGSSNLIEFSRFS